jgi:hypothetical protein
MADMEPKSPSIDEAARQYVAAEEAAAYQRQYQRDNPCPANKRALDNAIRAQQKLGQQFAHFPPDEFWKKVIACRDAAQSGP